MPGGSPTAYLLWSILSSLFFAFHLFHLWSYDKFQCLNWNQSGRQPGAFKRFMSYTYLATLICLVCFAVAFTYFKFQEGFVVSNGKITPIPLEYYSPRNKKWVLPLLLVFSVAWGCELVTHLEELTFWFFLQNQGPVPRLWFQSGEFRFWLWGTLFALLGMPLTTFISRKQLDSCFAWTLLVGSSASTATSLVFLGVLSRFPVFIRRVRNDGAVPSVVLRLVYFYQLNVGRIIYRFLFTVPLFVLSLDGVQGSHPVNNSSFWPDFLLMVGALGAFVSSGITLLIFFPRSLTQELGYTLVTDMKSPATSTLDVSRPPIVSHRYPTSPKDQNAPMYRSSSTQASTDSGHYTSPEYELEDPRDVAQPHVRMQTWNAHDPEPPRGDAFVFDRRSRSLVRSRSEGHATTLHPYVRVFRSPIDLCDIEAFDSAPLR